MRDIWCQESPKFLPPSPNPFPMKILSMLRGNSFADISPQFAKGSVSSRRGTTFEKLPVLLLLFFSFFLVRFPPDCDAVIVCSEKKTVTQESNGVVYYSTFAVAQSYVLILYTELTDSLCQHPPVSASYKVFSSYPTLPYLTYPFDSANVLALIFSYNLDFRNVFVDQTRLPGRLSEAFC